MDQIAPIPNRSLLRSEILVTALILAFLAFLLVGTTFVLRNEHQAVTEIAHVRTISAAEVVAANFEWVTETSHQLLQRVDDLGGSNLDAPSLDALVSGFRTHWTIWVT